METAQAEFTQPLCDVRSSFSFPRRVLPIQVLSRGPNTEWVPYQEELSRDALDDRLCHDCPDSRICEGYREGCLDG